MDYSKWVVLCRIAELNRQGVEWVKVQRDGDLIKDAAEEVQSDDVHALRMTWFGLLERQAIRTGLYRLTSRGWAFLAGTHRVPATIVTHLGKVLWESAELVSVREIKGVVLDRSYWTRYSRGEVDGGDLEDELS